MSSIAPSDLLVLIDRGEAPTILDVRSAAEFEAAHIPGAVNAPFTSIRSCVPAVARRAGSRVVLYCGHGPRAWIASFALRRHGIVDIIYLSGHWAGWRRAGLRVE